MILVDTSSWIHLLRPNGDKAVRARASGRTVPASDLLIAACARHHGAGLETADSDFDGLAEQARPHRR